MKFARLLGERYTPLYFLNALVAGGFALSSYMYIYWICKIELSSLPTFDALVSFTSFQGFLKPLFMLFFLCGFVFFSFLHVRLLIWNFKNMKVWQNMVPYKALMASKDKTVLLTIPATLAVSVILLLLTTLMAFPFALQMKDYLFPPLFVALAYGSWHCAHVYTALLASRLTGTASAHAFGTNLGQLIAVFAFTMIALPFALIAQNSDGRTVLVACLLTALLILFFAVLMAALRFGTQLKTLVDEPLAAETAPLFWFAGGILSVLALGYLQIDGGLARAYGTAQTPATVLVISGVLVVCCGWLGYVGYVAMRHHGVLAPLLQGSFYSQGMYAVLCPALGIGLVYGYFLNVALGSSGLFTPHSMAHFIGYAPLVALHAWAIRLFFVLNGKLFNGATQPRPDKQPKSPQ